MEADVQAYQLTKALPVPERPRAVEELRSAVEADRFRALIEKNIVMARNFESQEEFTPQDYPFGLLHNILKTVFMEGAQSYPALNNLHVAFERHVAGTWTSAGERIAVRGRPGTLLLSRTKLPQFYPDSQIEESKGADFNTVATNSPFIGLKQYRLSDKYVKGMFLGNSSFPNLHTMITIDNQSTHEIQLIQRGLLYTHARLMSQAITRHGSEIIGCLLPMPECAQCIVTNGKRFSFLWYQLNTLDVKSVEEGARNLVCVERPGLLYSKLGDVGKRKSRRRVVEDLNEDILTTLLSVLLLS